MMTKLTCPKCRQGIPDDSLDVGHCPACGFPLDGPAVLHSGSPGGGKRLLLALVGVALLAGAGVAGYVHFAQSPSPLSAPEAAGIPAARSEVASISVAPFPHEPKQRGGDSPVQTPTPPVEPGPGNPPEKKFNPVEPVVVEVPKKQGPRPIGVVMKVDPKIAPVRHFDQPDDTAALPDLNTADHVILTGKLRGLRIGSVNGKGSIDASGLVVEEVTITGDLNGSAAVRLNAPNGKVTIGGYVTGSARLTILAPGGEVQLASSSRVTGGGSTVTITARNLEAKGPITGGAKVNVTLNAGGSMRLTLVDEGAIVTWRKSAPGDPQPTIVKGDRRGGGKVVEGK